MIIKVFENSISECCNDVVLYFIGKGTTFYGCKKCKKSCKIKKKTLEINVRDEIKMKDVGPGQI